MSGFSSQSVASADYKYKQEISLLLLNMGMRLKSYRLWSDFAFSIYFPQLHICKCSVKNSLLGGKGHIIKMQTWTRELGIKKQLCQQWDGVTLVIFKVPAYLYDKRSCDHLIKSQEKSPAVLRGRAFQAGTPPTDSHQMPAGKGTLPLLHPNFPWPQASSLCRGQIYYGKMSSNMQVGARCN